jgi:hypothetical protein
MDKASQTLTKRIGVFFYGSFIRKDIMALGGFYPDEIEVAKLNGYDIAFDPHANSFVANTARFVVSWCTPRMQN